MSEEIKLSKDERRVLAILAEAEANDPENFSLATEALITELKSMPDNSEGFAQKQAVVQSTIIQFYDAVNNEVPLDPDTAKGLALYWVDNYQKGGVAGLTELSRKSRSGRYFEPVPFT